MANGIIQRDTRKLGMFFSEAANPAEGINIPANANINALTYCATGKYFCGASGTAQTLSNCPTNSAFQMLVFNLLDNNSGEMRGSWTSRTRLLMTFMGDIFIQYVRWDNGNVAYGTWQKVQLQNA